MAVFSKVVFSGSTNGRGIKVVATATPGTLIHTAHATAQDEIWLYAVNSDTVDRLLTIEFGGTTSPDDTIQVTITTRTGLVTVIPGIVLTNSLVVRAFAAAANMVLVHGYLNRIT